MSHLLTSTGTDFEAQVILGRLADAGIQALIKGGVMTRGGYVAGGRDIFVEDQDLDRARAALQAAEGIDEDELAALSEEAGRKDGPAVD